MTGHGIAPRTTATALLATFALVLSSAGPADAQTTAMRLVLSTNQSIFGPGTTLETTLGVEYGGAPVAVDLVFGVLAPDGETLITFQGAGLSPVFGRLSQPASLRSIVSSVTWSAGLGVVVPEFFRYTWQGNEPLGTYQLFFAATRPGAFADGRIDGGDVLAVQIAPFSLRAPATVTTDPARASTTVVPITGGTVAVTAADGTTFTLRVPHGALNAPTAITLTPVTAMAGVPGAMQNILAVRAEPEGLTFAVPASLTIHPATPGAAQGLVVGVPFGGIGVHRNVNSSLGVIRASDLNAIGLEANTGTSVAIEAGNIVTFGNPGARFTLQNNVGIPLSAMQVGNIAGNVTLRFNTGFTNQQAQAFVNARTVGGTVAISNNQP